MTRPEEGYEEMHIQGKVTSIKSVWKRIRDHLENERHRINQEIKNYPAPIPACDAQFNHLLEARARIGEELNRMEGLSKESLTGRDAIKCIEAFLTSSEFLGSEAEQRIRSLMAGVLDSSA